MDIKVIMDSLSLRRKVFHLESDFQFALAWEIQKHFPDIDVRLEVPIKLDKMARIDIHVRINGEVYPIELKYLKKAMKYEENGELFSLAEGVHDMDMYGCIADVSRLEKLKEKLPNFGTGYAVWLTNDRAYWSPDYPASYYKEFHAPENAVKTGKMFFSDSKNFRTQKPPQILQMRGYENPVILNGSYSIAWNDFSDLGKGVSNGVFKYAVVSVGK